MPLITKLTQQKNKNRVNVYLDGMFGFAVTLESAIEHSLKLGQVLQLVEVENLRGKDYLDKVFASLISFTSSRPHSEREIHNWFIRKKIEDKDQEDLFNRLKRIGLVNDEEFAKWWVEQRVHFRSMPQKMLKLELRGKGVKDEIAQKVLQETESPPEANLARKLLLKRYGRIPRASDLKEKKRVYDFLFRRGFSYGTIKSVLAGSDQEEYN